MAGGHGGKRIGSGRKPKTRTERWLSGNAGKRPLALVSASSAMALPKVQVLEAEMSAPAVLTEDEATYWALWAPLAESVGTLTPERIPGLVLLCQSARRAAALWAQIEAQGFLFETVTVDGSGQEHRTYKANPLLSHWRGLMGRIEQLQARYGLAADGKPPSDEAVPVDDERDQLTKLLSVR